VSISWEHCRKVVLDCQEDEGRATSGQNHSIVDSDTLCGIVASLHPPLGAAWGAAGSSIDSGSWRPILYTLTNLAQSSRDSGSLLKGKAAHVAPVIYEVHTRES
jgi:hypothetical protein